MLFVGVPLPRRCIWLFCIILSFYVVEWHFALVIHFVLFLLAIVNHCYVFLTRSHFFATITPHPVWIPSTSIWESMYTWRQSQRKSLLIPLCPELRVSKSVLRKRWGKGGSSGSRGWSWSPGRVKNYLFSRSSGPPLRPTLASYWAGTRSSFPGK
jgi:hypothetical protein